jgi:hypothetical protein
MPDQPRPAGEKQAPTHPVQNSMRIRKSKKAFKDGYNGHSDRYDQDEEYRENCIRPGFPRVLYLHEDGKAPMDADTFVRDSRQRQGAAQGSRRQ